MTCIGPNNNNGTSNWGSTQKRHKLHLRRATTSESGIPVGHVGRARSYSLWRRLRLFSHSLVLGHDADIGDN